MFLDNSLSKESFVTKTRMSVENNTAAPERTCYVQCNFCNTVLAVNVPSSNIYMTMVTVRCGHCANLLNMAASVQPLPQDLHYQSQKHNHGSQDLMMNKGSASSSSKGNNKLVSFESEQELPRLPPIRPPEKRQRVPSAYNRFIKEEIQRIKASNPDISHREAFSTAAKNWAHFPHIHFGLNLDSGNKQAARLDIHSAASADNQPKSHGFY